VTRLVSLYPRSWRDRYEHEFLALLSERPPDSLDRLDIVRGALDARLHPQVQGFASGAPPLPGSRWPVRVGWLTLLGGFLWAVALFVAVNGPIVVDEWGTYRDGGAAMPVWFIALILLGVGMITVTLGLPVPARAARAAAYVSSVVGLLWALAPWLLYAGIVAIAGLLVVAVSAWRAGRWSGLELGILASGVVLAWTAPIALVLNLWRPPEPMLDGLAFAFLSLASAWVVVGISLVRAPRRRAAAVDPSTV